MGRQKEKAPENNKPKKTAYLVCDGAICKCEFGAAPAKLTVKANQKVYINDDAKQLLATEKDFVFDPPTASFATCSKKPGQDKTCTPSFTKPWDKPYDSIDVMGNKVITDKSELMCMSMQGKVTIVQHGQKQKVSSAQADNFKAVVAPQINELAAKPKKKETPETCSVTGISGKAKPDEKCQPVTTQKRKETKSLSREEAKKQKDDAPDLALCPGEEATFTATFDQNDFLISWKVEDMGKGTQPVYYLMEGKEFSYAFPEEGRYRVEGYGTGKDADLDTDSQVKDNACTLDVVVKANTLTGIRVLESENVGGLDANKEKTVRAGTPVSFEPEFTLPPTADEISHLILQVKDGGGAILQSESGKEVLVFTPPNSATNYVIEAFISDPKSAVFSQKIISKNNAVQVIACNEMGEECGMVRPGTTLTFSVTDYTFKGKALDVEKQKIRWREVGRSRVNPEVATGSTFTKVYDKEGDYIVEAYVNESNSKWTPDFLKSKGEKDDWRFKVTKNYPVNITQQGRAKVGGQTIFSLVALFPTPTTQDLLHLKWQLVGPVNKEEWGILNFPVTFTEKGNYTVSVTLNGQTVSREIECVECEITEGWWTDGDGNYLASEKEEGQPTNTLGFASWGQEACVAFAHKGLEGEKMILKIWDRDYTSSNDCVFEKEITVPKEPLPGFVISLDEKMKEKAGSGELSSDGLLYFTLTPVNSNLKVHKSEAAFPSNTDHYLKVDNKVRVKAYFSDNNDSKRYSTASVGTPVYAQVKTTGLQEEEIKVEVWEDRGEAEPVRVSSSDWRKPDKYGMRSVDLKVGNIPMKTANETKQLFLKVFSKKRDKEEYSSRNIFSLTLYKTLKIEPAAKGTTKALVVVDVSGNNQKNEVCPNCEKDITIKELKKIFPDAADTTLTEIVSAFNDYAAKFEINTCLRKAHFWAQARQESGSDLSGALKGENLNYLVSVLKSGSPFSYFGKNHEEAEKYGRIEKDGKVMQKANQIMIANLAYDDANRTAKFKIGNNKEGDGWRFRGRGILQITGRTNYEEQQRTIDKILGTGVVDIIIEDNENDSGFTAKQAVVSGFADWYNKKCSVSADLGGEANNVDSITHLINAGTDTVSKANRKLYFFGNTNQKGKIEGTKEIFNVSECLGGDGFVNYIPTDMLTYRIYHDHRIELHIPISIKKEERTKYKYVYIDSNKVEHIICKVDFFEINGMNPGIQDKKSNISLVKGFKSAKTYENVDAKTSYYYENGDVISEGTKYKRTDHRILYKPSGKKVKLT